VVSETIQGGSTKVDKKAYQGESLDNLIVGHQSHNGFPMDVSSLGVGSHYKSLYNHQSFQPSLALSQIQKHYIHTTKKSNLL